MSVKRFQPKPMYYFLLLLTVAAAFGFQSWRTMFNNFAVDGIGLNGFEVGIVQSVREVPGFLALLVIFLLLLFKEHRLSVFSVMIMGVGVLLTGFFPSAYGLVFTTVIMSVGFHYFETTNQSLTLQYFSAVETPHVFARLRSVSALTNIFVGVFIFFMSKWFSFKTNYIITGVVLVLVAIYALTMKPAESGLVPQQKKMILKRKYWLFYLLNFLSGARRQIFVVFAVFMLVQKYDFSVAEVSILFVLNNIISYFFNPVIAKGINKFGERKMLSMEYIALIAVFIGYATIENRWIVAALYIIDHIFFNFSIGIKTFFQKYADPQDISPSMAVGFTINHISAVVIPVLGGILWLVNWQIPFIAGAVLGVVSLVFVQKIPCKSRL
ncbi:MAG: MFS transporter [Bacteroidales bacterium]|jgi:hypothetical protein|nr:MFS transporter [Bacteroidales bacterium]